MGAGPCVSVRIVSVGVPQTSVKLTVSGGVYPTNNLNVPSIPVPGGSGEGSNKLTLKIIEFGSDDFLASTIE